MSAFDAAGGQDDLDDVDPELEDVEDEADNFEDARCHFCGAGADDACTASCDCEDCRYAEYLSHGDPRSLDDFDLGR